MEDSLYEILFSSVHSVMNYSLESFAIRRWSKLLGQINKLSFFKKFILLYCSIAILYWKVFSIWSFSRLYWNHLTFCPGARWRWVISTTWITLNFYFYLKLKLFFSIPGIKAFDAGSGIVPWKKLPLSSKPPEIPNSVSFSAT